MELLRRRYRRMIVHGPHSVGARCVYYGLLPFARLYGWIGWVREWLYRRQLLPSEAFEVPVVSVGNLAVGGTGKTPMVDYVVRYLQAKGKKVAVVSRGYGGRGAGMVGIVSDGSRLLLSAQVAGDESRLLAQRNPSLIVIVAPQRRLGVRVAITQLAAEVVVLDDGFQHLPVRRDLDIVLLDAQRPLGNGQPLPAGLLREFPTALRRGQLFILTRATASVIPMPALPGPLLVSRHRLSAEAVTLDGRRVRLDTLTRQRVVAFAGVADPEAFFDDLKARGIQPLATLAFPDHVAYNRAELERIAATAGAADCLLTTEKDGVKLAAANFSVPCYQVPLELDIDHPELLHRQLDRLLTKEKPMSIKQELLDILACPQCKGAVRLHDDQQALVCDACRLAYPIRDDIPVMLIDEARISSSSCLMGMVPSLSSSRSRWAVNNSARRTAMGRSGARLLERNAGATDKTIAVIDRLVR